jgi:hypothetical protein
MASKTASQTAVPEPESSDDDDRPRAPFTFQQSEVELYEPVAGQRFILLQTIGVTDEGASIQERLELVLGFAAMLRALFVSPTERQAVTGALARGQADIEDYFELARQMAEHWDVEAEPATREERRARERRPAKALARPRSTRPR